MAKAVTSAMESQDVELIPAEMSVLSEVKAI